MRIEMHAQQPAPGVDPKSGARYVIDGDEVAESAFAFAVQRRREAPYRDAEWLFNGRPIDAEVLAQWRGVP